MDEFANRLREDATRIRADVNPELERRIRASLESVTPEKAAPKRTPRPPLFWLASTLTGLAAAIALIVVINRPISEPAEAVVVQTPVMLPDLPRLPLKVRNAMTTSPLEQELSNLQSDLEKARRAVKEDVEKVYDPADTP
jgi:BMFP domain-containing protein YqiC